MLENDSYEYNFSESGILHKPILRRGLATLRPLLPRDDFRKRLRTNNSTYTTAAHRYLSDCKFNETRFSSIPDFHEPITCLTPGAYHQSQVVRYCQKAYPSSTNSSSVRSMLLTQHIMLMSCSYKRTRPIPKLGRRGSGACENPEPHFMSRTACWRTNSSATRSSVYCRRMRTREYIRIRSLLDSFMAERMFDMIFKDSA